MGARSQAAKAEKEQIENCRFQIKDKELNQQKEQPSSLISRKTRNQKLKAITFACGIDMESSSSES